LGLEPLETKEISAGLGLWANSREVSISDHGSVSTVIGSWNLKIEKIDISGVGRVHAAPEWEHNGVSRLASSTPSGSVSVARAALTIQCVR